MQTLYAESSALLPFSHALYAQNDTSIQTAVDPVHAPAIFLPQGQNMSLGTLQDNKLPCAADRRLLFFLILFLPHSSQLDAFFTKHVKKTTKKTIFSFAVCLYVLLSLFFVVPVLISFFLGHCTDSYARGTGVCMTTRDTVP